MAKLESQVLQRLWELPRLPERKRAALHSTASCPASLLGHEPDRLSRVLGGAEPCRRQIPASEWLWSHRVATPTPVGKPEVRGKRENQNNSLPGDQEGMRDTTVLLRNTQWISSSQPGTATVPGCLWYPLSRAQTLGDKPSGK